MLILVGFCALSFGPQKMFGIQLSYLLLVSGRFSIAMGTYGVSINGYLLGNFFFHPFFIEEIFVYSNFPCLKILISYGNYWQETQKDMCFNF